MLRLTKEEYAAHQTRVKPVSKYRAVKKEIDGITFASTKEARRYVELKMLCKAGEISGLELQPRYDFIIKGQKVGSYRPDFQYYADGRLVVEDCKSKATRTEAYMLRRRIMKAMFGIDVLET